MKSRNARRIMCGILAASMILGVSIPAGSDAAKKAKPGFTKVTLKVGEKKKITIKNKVKGAKYTYKSSSAKRAAVSKSGLITARQAGKAKITVKQTLKKKTVKCGTITVTVKKAPVVEATPTTAVIGIATPVPATAVPANPTVKPVITDVPAGPTAPAATGEPTAEPTAAVTATPDVYTKEVLTLDVTETKNETVNGATCDVDMKFFTATSASDYFNGKTLNESATTIRDYHEDYNDGTAYTSARYILTGTDDTGASCKLFVEDNGIMNEDGSVVSAPIIFTDSKSLTWLETADLQSRISVSEDGKRTIHILWNESNDVPVTPAPVPVVDRTTKYDKQVFEFRIDIGGTDEVTGTNGKGTMIHFGGAAVGDTFTGKIVSDCTDTRKHFDGQIQTLSARYIIEGTDSNGNACRVFVDNIGDDEGGTATNPIIITDNPDFAWIETAPLHGTTSWPDTLHIHMWTTSD